VQKYVEKLQPRLKGFGLQISEPADLPKLVKELFGFVNSNELKGTDEKLQLKVLCLKLAKFLTKPDDLDLFVSCEGVGLQFLILSSCDELKSDLEFDCRGKVVIIPNTFARSR